MTPISILILTLSLYWCLINVKTITNISIPNSALGVFALITLYYSIYLAPLLYQSLYWRSASLPYFSPIVMGVLIFALITHQGIREKNSTTLTIAIGILSFLAGGFSEAGCATLTTALSIYVGLSWLFRKQTWAKRTLPVAITALMATLLSMVVLISSPTTTYRVGLYGEPAKFIDLPALIWKFSFDFVKFSFLDLPLPHFVLLGTSFLLGYLLYSNGKSPVDTRTVVIIVIITLIITFIIIASSFAPSAYIEKAPPHPRTRIIPRFALTLGLVFVSWTFGILATKTKQSKLLYSMAILMLVFFSLYSLRSVFIVSQHISVYSERANIWDARDSQIKAAVANGESTVYVNAIDGLPVGGIRDFDVRGQGKPGYWINRCAARFYGVGAIEISPP
jgi:hypothetical protein